MRTFERLIWVIAVMAFCVYAARVWTKWYEIRKDSGRGWRAVATVIGLCAATISTALTAFLLVHAQITGGYPFYHPVELFCIRYGSLTALVGIVAAIAGQGKVRLHLAAISVINLFLWFMDAMAQ